MGVEVSAVLLPGPWRHREVSANGTRFHVAEQGPEDGPVVLLLHGFPEFWWAWRHQLAGLSERGFRAVAVDLRGYGASDKPPRGYDAYTLTDDVAGLVRALGAQRVTLAGHGWGGLVAWSVATLRPEMVERLAVLSAAHPLVLLGTGGRDLHQLQAARHVGWFQVPRLAERRLLRQGAAEVGRLLTAWGGPGFPDEETERLCRAAAQIPGAAHCALEGYRWVIRSLARPSGHRFRRRLAEGVGVPVLQLQGTADPCLLPRTVGGSERFAHHGYRLELLPGVGHFPHEEAPAAVTAALLAHALA